MAAPITHFVLTEKIFSTKFAKFDKNEFLLWTLLPDIRYLKIIYTNPMHYYANSFVDELDSL